MNYEKFLFWLKRALQHSRFGAFTGAVIGIIFLIIIGMMFGVSMSMGTILLCCIVGGAILFFIPEFMVSLWFIILLMIKQLQETAKK